MVKRPRTAAFAVICLALALLACFLCACRGNEAASTEDSGKLDIGVAFPEDDWRTAFIKDFAQEIERESNGTIQTQLHYMDEYPDMQDLLKDMTTDTGKLDVALSANAYLADYSYPEFYVSGLPYLFEDFEDAWAFAESDVNAKVEEKLPQHGMRILSHFCGGFRNLATVRPIEGPQDLHGLVIATVKSPIMMDMLYLLGANPQPAVAGEFHEAMQKGVYDGIEVSVATYWRDKDYEYVPYEAITNHSYNLWSLIIDEGTWQGLTEEEQIIVKAAAEKYAGLERAESKRTTEEIIEKLKDNGVVFTYPDHETFKAVTEKVRQKYSVDYRETYEEAKRYLDAL